MCLTSSRYCERGVESSQKSSARTEYTLNVYLKLYGRRRTDCIVNGKQQLTNVCIKLCEKRKSCENIYNTAKEKKKHIKNIKQHNASAKWQKTDTETRIIRISCYSMYELFL